ncbi:DUF5655 domain-containing protein [Ktedonobacter racemifer]|uniref:DUF5655 domain-containing protein n=1 Tax=Ktedonobacter racemifer DSM 44963 TaxID=485913 RepID=D6TGT1_KTERA|nr:DUF5655 domain-containing protein [Ktedonobacter racemifer]EFH88860.1 conserved hypothetical protein [Ktedonobacter racemifer DSM 44963]
MSDRFAPNSSRVRPVLEKLKNDGYGEYLAKAYFTITHTNSKTKSVSDIERDLLARMDMGPSTPWVLYDLFSELMKSSPLASRQALREKIKIETGYMYERLRITIDGHWQITWEVDPDADSEYKEVALNWYIPPNQDSAPIVPLAIIDCIASSVLLLRQNLVLPAATNLSIALEAALWDALTYSGFSRYSEQLTYISVKWNIKKTADKFLLWIEGADKSVKDLSTNDGSPFTETLNLRKLQSRDSSEVVGLRVEVNKKLASFLVSDKVEATEQIKDRGFSVAIQKARREKLKCIEEIVPDFLDSTLVSLRNNLVHLPSQGKLDQPIPIEGQSSLQNVDDLRTNIRFVRSLLYKVVDIINTVYADQVQPVDDESSTGLAEATNRVNNNEKTAAEFLNQSPADLKARFELTKGFLLSLGKDVQMSSRKTYFAFKRTKNFACVEVHPQAKCIVIYVKVDPDSISLEKGFTRDVRNIGHYGTGNLEITIRSNEDLDRAKKNLLKSYEAN